MGQEESKARTDQIITSLNRMRKDMRNGKITANDVERIQEIIKKYSNEIGNNRTNRTKSIYTIEQLIEITSKELDALKQEVHLEPTSFSKNSTTNPKRKSIKSITEAVRNIRQQILTGNLKQDDYVGLQKELVNYSQLLSEKKSKKKDAEAAQKLISSVTQELLINQENPRRLSVSSLKENPKSRRSSISSVKSTKTAPKLTTKNTLSTLGDIEQKLEAVKSDLKVAESNKDKSRLLFLAKSVETLMTDLQMINVCNEILNEERKELLERNLQKVYQQIKKIKRQIVEEDDLSYLKKLQIKEQKTKALDELESINRNLTEISSTLNTQNCLQQKELLNTVKSKLNSFEEIDEQVASKKTEVAEAAFNLEETLTKIEMEERVNIAEFQHFQYKIDLDNFSGTTESEIYQRNKQYLLQLKEYVGKIIAKGDKLEEKKNYVLYNIDNNIRALDAKAKENKQNSEGVKLRKTKKDQVLALLKAAEEIPTDYSSQELQEIFPVFTQARNIFEKKLSLLTPQKDVCLVTVKEKLSPVINSIPQRQIDFDTIQRDVEALQLQIENSRYTKETQFYKEIKNKLENFRNEVFYSDPTKTELLNYIDNVLLLLENNFSSRRSTTEDLLIDIMSVSTRVNDLGGKMYNSTNSVRDYEAIESSLKEHSTYLRNLKIAPNRGNLMKCRDEVLAQIDHYLTNLDAIRRNSNSTVSEEEKLFNQSLRNLKEKVNRYSGTYKNVLYKTIENDLEKYSKKAPEVFKDEKVASKIQQDIENTKMILEQKSTKDPHYNTMDLKKNELTEIYQNIENVKQQLAQNQLLSKQDLDKLDARLTLSIVSLDNLKDETYKLEKEKLYEEIKLYFQKIQEIMLISQSNSILDTSEAATLAQIEQELELVKPQIETFVGTETSPNFLQLDEVLVRGTLKLDEMAIDPASNLSQTKLKLMKEIQKYADILDERIAQTEEIEKLEKEVRVVFLKIDAFNGFVGDAEYTSLDEEIIRLKVNLGKLHVNPELRTRREECVREIDSCMKKLNETARKRPVTGTLV